MRKQAAKKKQATKKISAKKKISKKQPARTAVKRQPAKKVIAKASARAQTAAKRSSPKPAVTAKPAARGRQQSNASRSPATKQRRAAKPQLSAHQPSLFYKVHALLHTVRTIGQYEDQLCTLMTDIRNTGAVSTEVSRELLDLLEDMPSADYASELHALRRALDTAA